jgi:hypothetical protein
VDASASVKITSLTTYCLTNIAITHLTISSLKCKSRSKWNALPYAGSTITPIGNAALALNYSSSAICSTLN